MPVLFALDPASVFVLRFGGQDLDTFTPNDPCNKQESSVKIFSS